MRLILTLLIMCAADPAAAQEMEYGEAEYQLTCAECHGSWGRGDGALAREFGLEPSDLTLLSERNGGEFPYWQVYWFIDGRHDSGGGSGGEHRSMPAFGPIFAEKDQENYGPEVGSALTERRIHALTRYVESLQR